MKLKPLLQAIYIIGTYSSLDKQLAELFHSDSMEQFNGRTIYLVKNPTNHDTIYFASFENSDSISSGIVDSLSKLNSLTVQNVTLILSTYPHQDIHLQTCPNKHEQLGSFLTETNGWIVYHHQLEFLYQMASQKRPVEAAEFRKKFNSKNHSFLKKIPDYPLFGSTLNVIIEKRLIHPSTCVCSPQYAAGYKLFEYLNE